MSMLSFHFYLHYRSSVSKNGFIAHYTHAGLFGLVLSGDFKQQLWIPNIAIETTQKNAEIYEILLLFA